MINVSRVQTHFGRIARPEAYLRPGKSAGYFAPG